jgi:hypothetical protein
VMLTMLDMIAVAKGAPVLVISSNQGNHDPCLTYAKPRYKVYC